MADGHDDGSLAPRRRLSGPILPPPPPELVENARKAEQDKAAAERADAEKEVARQVLAAQKAHTEQHARSSAESRARAKAATEAQTAAQAKGPSKAQARADTRARAKAQVRAQIRDHGKDQGTDQGRTRARRRATPSRGRCPRWQRVRVPQQARTVTRPAPSSGRATPRSGKPPSKKGGPRRTRRAQLRLVQVDAWSVMKTSFLLSIALGIVLVVAVSIIWSVLGAAGVWESINSIVQQAVGSTTGKPFDIQEYVGTSRVLGLTMIVAVLDVILITAMATLGAFLYNLSAALLGGIEVTLAEDG